MNYIFIFLIGFVFNFAGCSNNPASGEKGISQEGKSVLNIFFGFSGESRAYKSTETKCSVLIVTVRASGRVVFRDTSGVAGDGILTVAGVPSGSGREISLHTEDDVSDTVHISEVRTSDLSAGGTINLSFTLNPVIGSIYIVFSDIDPLVDSVYSFFESDKGLFSDSSSVSSGRATLVIDKVPDSSEGMLQIYGIDKDSFDTLYSQTLSLIFSSSGDNTLEAAFHVPPGEISGNISVIEPGVTLVQGYMNDSRNLGPENGPLIISEILYSANDSEFVEIHNPSDMLFSADTIFLEVNGVLREFTGVDIQAGGYFVIGRQELSYADIWHSTYSALDLAATFEFIALRGKDSVLMDCISFTGYSNDTGWPQGGSSSGRSIVLKSDVNDPVDNNYGKNWLLSESQIEGTGLSGTPGGAGY
ncbi:MAG: hypothetical protein ACLFQK_02780 [Fibrobacterota bacterium]